MWVFLPAVGPRSSVLLQSLSVLKRAWPSLQERLASESQHRLKTFLPSGACAPHQTVFPMGAEELLTWWTGVGVDVDWPWTLEVCRTPLPWSAHVRRPGTCSHGRMGKGAGRQAVLLTPLSQQRFLFSQPALSAVLISSQCRL